MRWIRLAVATALLPLAGFGVFQLAIRFDGNPRMVDAIGNTIAIAAFVVALAGISRLAADEQWWERFGTALAIGVTYFALTWLLYGDPGRSVDEAPHLIWLATSIVAFSPAVVIMPACKWGWANYTARKELPFPR